MTKTKINCPSCGKDFEPKSKTRRYCYDCDVKTREAKARKDSKKEKKCLQCGNAFVAHSKIAKYCGDDCRIKFNTRKTSFRADIPCVICETVFTPSSKVNKTCSTKCSRRQSYLASKVKNVEKTCIICNTEFLPKSKLHVCCSEACSDIRARKAQKKEITCIDCGDTFTHSSTGSPKRCKPCRENPMVPADKPCAYCGKEFKRQLSENPRFCSRSCSSSGIHSEGLGNMNDPVKAIQDISEFISNARHTPGIDEICEETGYSDAWVRNVLNEDINSLYKKAGRENKHRFPSRFEEQVYYALLDAGIKNEDIERQKKFPKLKGPSNRWPLRYDFYIKSHNLLVEADGPQHYTEVEGARFDYESIRACDKLKNDYAKINGIPLVRLPYKNTFKRVTKLVSQQLVPLISNG